MPRRHTATSESTSESSSPASSNERAKAKLKRRFRFGDRIGSGGMGIVRNAERVDEDGNVIADHLAVKELKPAFRTIPEAVARFKREVKLQAALKHRNVMPVIARKLNGLRPWFVMPRAESSLEDEVRAGRGSDRSWLTDTYRQVLAGVAHAHARDVIHRDIKPPNVLFVQGVPKVSDLGLGKSLAPKATELTRTKQRMGTKPYMAPEQFRSPRRVGKPADVFSLGKLLVKMVSGKTPAQGAVDLASVPKEFRYFVSRCCDQDPAKRYQDAGEALAAFERLLGASDVVDAPVEAAEKLVEDARDADDPGEALEALDAHLHAHEADEVRFTRLFPRLPKKVLRLYIEQLPAGFAAALATYDEHIDGSLPFDYCDAVADFYRQVFKFCDDLDVRRRVLRRLIVMGAQHNRWHVRDVVCGLLADIDDASTATMAADVIDAELSDAAWHADEALQRPLRRPIAEALRRVGGSPGP
jgi:hypothetical protein